MQNQVKECVQLTGKQSLSESENNKQVFYLSQLSSV